MIEFTKMHGLGNDYLFVDCLDGRVPEDPGGLAARMSDRHFGAGADGLVLILPPEKPGADCRMRMFNADGSEAEMCGTAIRCLAKWVYEHGKIMQERMRVETGAGLLTVELSVSRETVSAVRVDMGEPGFAPGKIPVKIKGERVVEHPLNIDDHTFGITCVSMGNPHTVIFVDDPVEELAVGRYGPLIENHELFPGRTNVEFVNLRAKNTLRQRTWERGSGETLACGTGASASAVAAVITGRCDPGEIRVDLNGGRLIIEWRPGEHVYMTGPAVEVFTGWWPD